MSSSLRLFLVFLLLTMSSAGSLQAEIRCSQELSYSASQGEEATDKTSNRISIDLEEDDDFVKFGDEIWIIPIAGKAQAFNSVGSLFIPELIVPPPEQ